MTKAEKFRRVIERLDTYSDQVIELQRQLVSRVALGPEALAERLSGDPAWLRLTMHLEASNPEAYPWR